MPVPDAAPRLRRATEDDIFLLAEAIRAADAGATEVVSLQRLFDLSNLELQQLLLKLAGEDVEGNEWSWPNFWLLVHDDPAGERLLAACAAWVEGADGLPSAMAKAQLLAYLLGTDRWRAAAPRLDRLASIDIAREQGALQLDSIYVRSEARGSGALGELLNGVIAQMQRLHPQVDKAQILLMDGNGRAERAYAKLGFDVVRRSHTVDPQVPFWVSGSGRVLMERDLPTTQKQAP